MSAHPLWQLVRNRDFMRVWWAGLISWTGNYTLFVALPVYVYNETASTLATGLSVTASALPTVIVGQLAGVLVDRWDYRRTMLFGNLVLAAVTPLYLLVLNGPWWLIIPIALAQASAGQLLGPAENALLPTLVDKERLRAANSLNALNNNLARLIGPAVGGLLIGSVGFAGVVIVDALTYLVAALLILGMKARKPSGRSNPERVPPEPFIELFRDWRDGLVAVRASPLLRLSFVAAALVGFGEGFISTLMAPFVEVMLGGGGPELGYIFSAQAVGGVVAGLLLTGFADRIPLLSLLTWGGMLSGLLLIPIFNYPLVYPMLWPILILTALAGLPFAAWGTAQMTLLQSEAEPCVRGRVLGAYFAMFGSAQLVGMVVSGLLGDLLGVMVINVDAVTYLLSGFIALGAAWRLRKADKRISA